MAAYSSSLWLLRSGKMCRAVYFALVSLALFGAVSCAAIDSEPAPVIVDNIDSYLNQNRGVALLKELERSDVQSKASIRYTFGSHVSGTISVV